MESHSQPSSSDGVKEGVGGKRATRSHLPLPRKPFLATSPPITRDGRLPLPIVQPQRAVTVLWGGARDPSGSEVPLPGSAQRWAPAVQPPGCWPRANAQRHAGLRPTLTAASSRPPCPRPSARLTPRPQTCPRRLTSPHESTMITQNTYTRRAAAGTAVQTWTWLWNWVVSRGREIGEVALEKAHTALRREPGEGVAHFTQVLKDGGTQALGT